MSSSKDPQKPPAFSTDSSMADDAKAVGGKVKENLDPKTALRNAALALSGVKPYTDAAKAAANTAEADGEASQGEGFAPPAGMSVPSPDEGAPAPAGDGKHRAETAAAGQGVGDSTRSASGSTKGEKVQEGAAKGTELAGRAFGAKGAGNFVRKSDSDGSLKGDVKSMSSGAQAGAKIGAAFAGVGAPVGAAIGATAQGIKTKNGRRMMVLGMLAPMAPLLVIVGLIVALIATSLVFIAPATMDALESGPEEVSMAAAVTDGVPQEAITIYQEAGEDAGVPWQVLGAIVQVVTGTQSGDETEPMSADEVDDAKDSDDPVGPYGLKIQSLDDQVVFTSQDDGGDYRLGLNGFEDRDDLFAHLNDVREASQVVAPLLGSILSDRHGDLDSYDLGAGVILDEPDDSNYDLERVYDSDTSDESDSGEVLDQNGNATGDVTGQGTTGNADADALREAYLDALGQMPIDDAEGNAGAIFDQAMQWYFGQSAQCDTNTTGTSAMGGWTDPVKGPITSPYGMRLHPVRLVWSLHDGTDIGAPNGTPVYAASSGTATISAADASWGGPHVVVIDHGNGVQTVYGHMDSNTVQTGDTVSAGQQVGTVGSQGLSTGNHLHFTVRINGDPTDPVPFMKEKGINLGVDEPGQVIGGPAPGAGTGSPTGSTGTPTGGVTGNAVRIIQANIPMRSNDFGGSLDKVVADGPDFVSLNEVRGRSAAALSRPGYSVWRQPTAGQDDGTAVMWRTDKWTEVSHGRIIVVADGPIRTDKGRAATWVKVTGDLGTMSMVSTHMMVNPAKYGPNMPLRQSLYRQGMEKIQDLVSELSQDGPVFVAGDMNSQYTANDPWGPRKMLGEVGMKPTFDTLGAMQTHHGAGIIDYIFGQVAAAVPTRQWTINTDSDHFAIGSDWTVDPNASTGVTPTALPESWTGKSSQGEEVTLDKTQLGFAATVAAKGTEMGVSDDGVIISFMTALTESTFKNYASDVYPETIGKEYPAGSVGSDHDSVGLFQQRPASGWGSPMELLDPAYEASAFFGGPQGPNGGSPMGLLDHTGWESRPKGDVAQDVQASAFPDRYAAWETAATELLGVVKGAAASDDPCAGVASGTDIGGYTVATLNVLGDSHTAPGGDKHGWPQATTRMKDGLELLASAGVSVAGLQEAEQAQQNVIIGDSGWSIYPETVSKNQSPVIWNSDWTLVEGKEFETPYLGGTTTRPQSYVRLRSNATGSEIYVISVHNAANAHGSGAPERAEALRIEKNLVETLSGSGLPVYLVGDFNDRVGPYCALSDTMTLAFGTGSKTPCAPPKGTGVDQIYTTGESGFSSYHVDVSTKAKQITDHPLVTATIGAATGNAQGAIDYALEQVGKGYSQAANLRLGPNYFDCSGLVYMAYKSIGVTLGTYTGTQQKNGQEISSGDLQPGDLIFYYAPISHVAIYLGTYNGVESVVHAANPRDGVEVMPRAYMKGDEVMYRRVQ